MDVNIRPLCYSFHKKKAHYVQITTQENPSRNIYIITLRIQALSLVESHDVFEDRRTELRHTKHYPIAFPYLYSTRDICNFIKFRIFQISECLGG
jgi:hypothetical protein